jgi:aerobic-type carbon monoxide dehydrogenase small subunit (CoxS/CutS family)
LRVAQDAVKELLNCVLTLALSRAGYEALLFPAGGKLHPIQEAFIEHNAFQCSYCTPGFILTTKSFLEENPNPTVEEIRAHLSGNLCRCGSYIKIQAAVLDAARRLQSGST